MSGEWDKVFEFFAGFVFNGDFSRSAFDFSVGDDAVDGADNGGVGGCSCFEEGGDSW